MAGRLVPQRRQYLKDGRAGELTRVCLGGGTHDRMAPLAFMMTLRREETASIRYSAQTLMSEARLTSLMIGSSPPSRTIAVRRREGKSPGILWLGGFKSDMKGTKAEALDRWAENAGRACVRFDYSGHGESDGDFSDGTIGRWLEESLAVYARFAQGPQVVIGSSMGGACSSTACALVPAKPNALTPAIRRRDGSGHPVARW